MEQFQALEALEKLTDKVVVITGGGNGIGAATVRLCISKGAAVVFGDIAVKAGQAVLESLGDDSKASFVQLDVTSYDSIIRLFDTALQKYGRVDYAITCAGLIERPGWFDLSKDIESVKKCPTTAVVDVNLTGTLYFCEIAVPYLRHGKQSGEDQSLILLSSVAGFNESPGLPTYSASKHGVLGLMRALRNHLYPTTGIRVNTFCPFGVATGMIAGFEAAFRAAGIPINEVDDTASIIMQAACEGKVNGKAFYLEGGRAWDIEEPLERLRPQWMGERQNADLLRGGEVLSQDPTSWDKGAIKTQSQSS